MQNVVFRLSEETDLAQIADLRWRLKTDDAPDDDRDLKNAFLAEFQRRERQDGRRDLFHWVAEQDGRILAIMSIVIVRGLPSPDDLGEEWAYIANSYALPEARNRGIGSALLAAIKDWAKEKGLELLLVWPSERAYPFYERSGFERRIDPLVLLLT